MKYDNALALRVSLETGARIGDVLALRLDNLQGRTLRYVAAKTGKLDRKVISAALAGVNPAGLSPHFARKDYAVEVFREKGFAAAQEALQHDRADTTMLYCFSDLLTDRVERGSPYIFTSEEIFFLAEIIANKVVEKLEKSGKSLEIS